MDPQPRNLAQLATALESAWLNIPENTFRDQSDSLPARLAAVRSAKEETYYEYLYKNKKVFFQQNDFDKVLKIELGDKITLSDGKKANLEKLRSDELNSSRFP
ncbi:transposable element Tcb1 transposase [Trichonephila clavipes]|nr:transposable element Tcb1 transposase [Trichonephila clavipes]